MTEIVFVIDASGSMYKLTDDTIGGFNGFIAAQKDGSNTVLTTVLFSNASRILHDRVNINEVEPLTTKDYEVGGSTAMLDAIGETINRIQDKHDELGEEKPDNVLFVITTDGKENSSHKFKKQQIEKMIKHQTNGHGWKFIFLGANMDAVQEANDIGISSQNACTYDYTGRGVGMVYETVCKCADAVKTSGATCDIDVAQIYTNLSTEEGVDGDATTTVSSLR